MSSLFTISIKKPKQVWYSVLDHTLNFGWLQFNALGLLSQRECAILMTSVDQYRCSTLLKALLQ